MVEKIVQRRLFIPDDKIEEARRDYEMQTDPRNLITYNDGYHERSIREKWGMSSSETGELLKGTRKPRRSTVRAMR